MRHRKLNTQLNRTKSHRIATVRNIVRAVLTHERITTTVKKAKACARVADKMITLAKKNNLPAIRRAVSLLGDKTVVHRLFNEIGPRYANRNGGYTRVMRLHNRRGDGAELAILELTEKAIMMEETPSVEKKSAGKSTQIKDESVDTTVIEDAVTIDESDATEKAGDAKSEEPPSSTITTDEEPKDLPEKTEEKNDKK